ncbi:MAG: LamG domain-containing protein [Verrucomicrobiota bacterium]
MKNPCFQFERLLSRPIVVALFVTTTLPCALADTVGYWRLEGAPSTPAVGIVLDYSGNGLNGTAINGPLYSGDIASAAQGIGSTTSMQLNGLTQRVTVPDAAALALTHSLTIEAYVKAEPMAPGTGGGGNILIRSDTRPGLDPYRLTLNQGNILSLTIQDAANNTAGITCPIAFDQWTQVAGTLDDATGEMKLFVNGILTASRVTSIRPLADLNPAYAPGLGIGGDRTGQYGEYVRGWLDEVRLSNVALTPDQMLPPVPEPSSLGLLALALAARWIHRSR